MRGSPLGRLVGAVGARRFRTRPLVPDAAFQDAEEPWPGHWRRPPEPWPSGADVDADAVHAALRALPPLWREVLLRHDGAGPAGSPDDGLDDGPDDAAVARALGLTVAQERAVLARARAALRDRLDPGATRRAGGADGAR